MSQGIATDMKVTNSSSTSKKFFTVRKFADRNRESGAWPESEAAIWALRAGAPQNGFGSVLVTVGRRVLIDEEKFWEAVVRLQEKKNASSR
jgi:hypothetical protein